MHLRLFCTVCLADQISDTVCERAKVSCALNAQFLGGAPGHEHRRCKCRPPCATASAFAVMPRRRGRPPWQCCLPEAENTALKTSIRGLVMLQSLDEVPKFISLADLKRMLPLRQIQRDIASAQRTASEHITHYVKKLEPSVCSTL